MDTSFFSTSLLHDFQSKRTASLDIGDDAEITMQSPCNNRDDRIHLSKWLSLAPLEFHKSFPEFAVTFRQILETWNLEMLNKELANPSSFNDSISNTAFYREFLSSVLNLKCNEMSKSIQPDEGSQTESLMESPIEVNSDGSSKNQNLDIFSDQSQQGTLPHTDTSIVKQYSVAGESKEDILEQTESNASEDTQSSDDHFPFDFFESDELPFDKVFEDEYSRPDNFSYTIEKRAEDSQLDRSPMNTKQDEEENEPSDAVPSSFQEQEAKVMITSQDGQDAVFPNALGSSSSTMIDLTSNIDRETVQEADMIPDALIANMEEEVRVLTEKSRVLQRDAASVTDTMIDDIKELLCLFGIPYVDSPSEAEAQCAFLERNGLVDGIITDDNDVFLFGGSKVYRYFFDQSKDVQLYLSSDIEREFCLSRERLITLSCLLGSDYCTGVIGVGVVAAFEVLNEWCLTQGFMGLFDFVRWFDNPGPLITPGLAHKLVRNKERKLLVPHILKLNIETFETRYFV
jgi:hypothetical protein